ncbi:hypothetical protein ORV05_33725 [Amycolatopsis cynarae]|uniref:PE domain-containing protein n=1 Tax=Amycolatopsis cynarae TaxID=2995223 RepID=A0ABY7B3G5_9PSEU|nr:hypothetical protein [Amycolatopsis sp. HUAS 11-8]WAL65767.1 hypothetical protein ORV05_33725 [Amycolatopsis sp. HUAS 11-8]
MAENTVSALSTTVPSVPGAMDIQVEPDKVAQVARIINDQADALDDKIHQLLLELSIDAPAGDVVSATAADAWNRLIASGDDSYAGRVMNYLQQLRALARQLRTAADTYQLGEDEKITAFGDRRDHQN